MKGFECEKEERTLERREEEERRRGEKKTREEDERREEKRREEKRREEEERREERKRRRKETIDEKILLKGSYLGGFLLIDLGIDVEEVLLDGRRRVVGESGRIRPLWRRFRRLFHRHVRRDQRQPVQILRW